MKIWQSHSLEETDKIASDWLSDITSAHAKSDEAFIAGLSGHLGSGKTAFVKAVAKHLGIIGEVTSPTFVLMKIYETKDKHWRRLIHIDAYRLEKREELETLQFERLVSDRQNLIMIEWPENVGLEDEMQNERLRFDISDGAHLIERK